MCTYCVLECAHTYRQLFTSSHHREQNERRETDFFLFFHPIRHSSAASETMLANPFSGFSSHKTHMSMSTHTHLSFSLHTKVNPGWVTDTQLSWNMGHNKGWSNCTQQTKHGRYAAPTLYVNMLINILQFYGTCSLFLIPTKCFWCINLTSQQVEWCHRRKKENWFCSNLFTQQHGEKCNFQQQMPLKF